MSNEAALALGPQHRLIGVYTPAATPADLAVVMLNAGLIHHVGPHRLYVKLARALAARGIAAARVDFGGVGDSLPQGEPESADAALLSELREVLAELGRRGHDRVILLGLCSGALAARELAGGADGVCGVVLINSGARSDDEAFAAAATRFYLRRSLFKPRAWWNLVTGRVKYGVLLRSLFTTLRAHLKPPAARAAAAAAGDPRARVSALTERGVAVLAILSGRHAEAFALMDDDLADLRRSGQVRIETHAGVDHLFTSLAAEQALIGQVCDWAGRFAGAAPARRALP